MGDRERRTTHGTSTGFDHRDDPYRVASMAGFGMAGRSGPTGLSAPADDRSDELSDEDMDDQNVLATAILESRARLARMAGQMRRTQQERAAAQLRQAQQDWEPPEEPKNWEAPQPTPARAPRHAAPTPPQPPQAEPAVQPWPAPQAQPVRQLWQPPQGWPAPQPPQPWPPQPPRPSQEELR